MKHLRLILCASALFWCVYAVLPGGARAALSTDLNGVVTYPNPFDASKHHTAITFDNLTADAKIRIYKVTGELVYDASVTTADGRAVWNLTNSDGKRVATGMYIYLVTNEAGGKTMGKFAVIQ